MSRDNTPFSEAGQDGYLPVYAEEFGGSGAFFDGEDTPTFSSTFDQDTFDDLGLGLHGGKITPAEPHAENGIATSVDGHSSDIDFETYTFEHNHQRYPVPNNLDRGPNPYPPHLQKSHAFSRKSLARPLPYRSVTNTSTPYAPSAVQSFTRTDPPHRRSWSQNDVERLPHLGPQLYPLGVRHQPPFPHQHVQTPSNPTFVRLCETRHPRPSAKISSDRKTQARYTHSQTRVGHNARSNPSTSMPVDIGVSLSPESQKRAVPTSGNVQLTGPPKLVSMSHSEQRKTSQRIIEVGAMAVLNMPPPHAHTTGGIENIDPRLLLIGCGGRKREKSGAPSPEAVGEGEEMGEREMMLRELGRMERILREGGGVDEEKGLRGCDMIREVLGGMGDKGGGRRGPGKGADKSWREDELLKNIDKDKASTLVSSDEGSPLTDEEFIRELVEEFPSA